MERSLLDAMFKALRFPFEKKDLLSDKEKDLLRQNAEKVYDFSCAHDMAHLVGYAFEELGVLQKEDEHYASFEKKKMAAIYRYTLNDLVFKRVCAALEEAHIDYIPLKGAVIRNEYPEPWMRTSSDIDLLLHKEDVEKASLLMTKTCGFSFFAHTAHDVSFFSQENVHIELHYDLIEEKRAGDAPKVLERVWDYAYPAEKDGCRYLLNDAMFYFYHVAHMAKHVEGGGCGIRPFLDLTILEKRQNADRPGREKLLSEGKLTTFAEAAKRLSAVWFSGKTHDNTSLLLEGFVLHGGVYGSEGNRILLQQGQKGGKARYTLTRIFPSWQFMKYRFPVLQKCPLLLPFCYVARLFIAVFGRKSTEAANELRQIGQLSQSDKDKASDLLRQIGL